MALQIQGEIAEAREHYAITYSLAQAAADSTKQAEALLRLGNIHNIRGEIEQASDYFQQALAIARQIGDRRGEGNILGSAAHDERESRVGNKGRGYNASRFGFQKHSRKANFGFGHVAFLAK